MAKPAITSCIFPKSFPDYRKAPSGSLVRIRVNYKTTRLRKEDCLLDNRRASQAMFAPHMPPSNSPIYHLFKIKWLVTSPVSPPFSI